MDDSCAVCAESLEWVAYGACGHKEVCSTCVTRLRFICDDRCCCICKTESDAVFVTKALGDYTMMISDFSPLLSKVKEGRVGQYWYHEDTQALFDDLDHYKMINAMCRLSCSICDKMEDQPDDGTRRKAKFKNIEQLKGHLFHKHRLFMCSLCLEGRKVFICEQKLYTRAQLTQHIKTGDSEVDGTEHERGGFMGHPECEFCRTPFYGDNELYRHMSTEHYTCHFCQRQHPGQYEYYNNYDDLETHFRRDHFLCEDEGCLTKKFVVFLSEAELKRHNTLEHGGSMSRSKRSAALQIPTSFRYRRNNNQDNRPGRERRYQHDPLDSELSPSIEATPETTNAPSSSTLSIADCEQVTDFEMLFPALESSATTDSEPSSRSLQTMSQNLRNAAFGESAFPPLPLAPGSSRQNSRPGVLPRNTMAAQLRGRDNRKVNASSSALAWPAATRTSQQAIAPHALPSKNNASGSTSTSGKSRLVTKIKPAPSGYPTSSQAPLSSVADSSLAPSLISSRNLKNTSQTKQSSSTPNLSELDDSSKSGFPPVSAAHTCNLPAANQSVVKVDEVRAANKSLVEKMRVALGSDEEKFNAFKEISVAYRRGAMDAETYIVYVVQFGLTHLILELARLLPDAQKQKELIETYNANMFSDAAKANGWSNGIHIKDGNSSKKGKGKGKSVGSSSSTSKNNSDDKVISTLKELQSSYGPSEEAVEVLSKDGYRAAKGKSNLVADDLHAELSRHGESTKSKSEGDLLSAAGGSHQNPGNGNGNGKQRKKTSKFHRVRLGDDSVEAIFDLNKPNPDPDPDPDPKLKEGTLDGQNNPTKGVWQNGGGCKLLIMTSRKR